jgi:hypothetical protein
MLIARSSLVVHSFALVAALAAATAADARPNYPGYLPNGSAIDGRGCVNCHNNANGGGSRNSFGSAISNAGLNWSSVCHLDSDGDGQTNGQEMGDPDCVWSGSGPGARTTALSNPGKASSTSSNPTGGSVATGEGEGEGEGEGGVGEGEGEGEGGGGGDVAEQCPSNASLVAGACQCGTGFVANSAGNACVSGTGSSWKCDPTWLGDGSCDCGCGAPDTDCANNNVNTCQYNDCDTWQTTQGLQPENNDPTQCAGGAAAGGSTAVSGTCPQNAHSVAGGCACDAGAAPDANHAHCVVTGGEGEGEQGGEGEGQQAGEGEGQLAGEGEGEQGGGEGEGQGGGGGLTIPNAPLPASCAHTNGSWSAAAAAALALVGVARRRRNRSARGSR